MSLHIWKWIKGWRLDKLFTKDTPPLPDISVKDATTKAVDFLTKVQTFINSSAVGFLEALLPGEWQAVVDSAKSILSQIISDLSTISTIPDIATTLDKYRFAEDDNRNKLYHDIVTSVAYIFSDGKLSLNDAAVVLKMISDFTDNN